MKVYTSLSQYLFAYHKSILDLITLSSDGWNTFRANGTDRKNANNATPKKRTFPFDIIFLCRVFHYWNRAAMLIVTRLLGKSEKRLGRGIETWRMILGNGQCR